MTYDDLLLAARRGALGADGDAAAARLRARYDVVLVDEFQDTDPVQWNIMQRAFGEHDGALILIGDPKQAIYAFRGADVYAYLDAARAAATRATLDVNRRSDQGLIDAYDALFDGAKLGHEGSSTAASTPRPPTERRGSPGASRRAAAHQGRARATNRRSSRPRADSRRCERSGAHRERPRRRHRHAALARRRRSNTAPRTEPPIRREPVRPGHIARARADQPRRRR